MIHAGGNKLRGKAAVVDITAFLCKSERISRLLFRIPFAKKAEPKLRLRIIASCKV